MSLEPEAVDPERCGLEYVAVLAQTWAAVEPRQQWIDNGYARARTIDELVSDFLLANDPFPVGTAVFAARWQPGRWGLAHVVSRDDMDEWTVVFIDGSGQVMRDHVELCPVL